jgi:hypothetical protein
MSGGKPSYSHVVTVSGSGKIVYTAGQLACDVDGNCVGKGDMRAQMEQTFQDPGRCLKAAGATGPTSSADVDGSAQDLRAEKCCADNSGRIGWRIKQCRTGLRRVNLVFLHATPVFAQTCPRGTKTAGISSHNPSFNF